MLGFFKKRVAAIIQPHRHVFHVNGLASVKSRKGGFYTGRCDCGAEREMWSDTWRYAQKEGESYGVEFETLAAGKP